jgi:hypothetical protein
MDANSAMQIEFDQAAAAQMPVTNMMAVMSCHVILTCRRATFEYVVNTSSPLAYMLQSSQGFYQILSQMALACLFSSDALFMKIAMR